MSRTRTPRQWREILDAFEHSNLSQAEFCRRRGLALATFRYRRARTNTRVSAQPPRLVELFTVPPSVTPPEALLLELDLPLGPVAVHGHPALIAELLSVLASTPFQSRP
jgi:hypothetical protein